MNSPMELPRGGRMAIAETLAAKTISESFLQKLATIIVGVCSTMWISFAMCAMTTAPVTIAGRVATYLGFAQVDIALRPIEHWFSEPTRAPLFVGLAILAGVMFNLGGAPILPIHVSAPMLAWVFFLPAVQGIGVVAASGIAFAVGCCGFLLAWTRSNDPYSRQHVRIAVQSNALANVFIAFFPFSFLFAWFLVSYRGDLPAGGSGEDTKPTGAAPAPSGPLWRRED